MNREDIQIISRHSNWSEAGIEKELREEIYPDANSLKKFLQFFFISLGVGFTVSGIIFFFAYNWAGLHKFAKIGMIEGIIVILTFLILFSKLNQVIKNILLTGTAVIIGVLLAVFGQVYQTGANAYDFFLGWTAFISLWVLISNYPPLWLIYIVLANTTFILYTQQVARHWTEVFILSILFIFNALILAGFLFLPKYVKELKVPSWFTSTISLATVSFSTIGIITGIFGEHQSLFVFLIIMTTLLYGAGIIYGVKSKNGFYLSIIPFSMIVIFSALLIKVSDGAVMFFTVSLFIVVSVTFLIKALIDFQKKWNKK
jgi:uncharacterized membrane protein